MNRNMVRIEVLPTMKVPSEMRSKASVLLQPYADMPSNISENATQESNRPPSTLTTTARRTSMPQLRRLSDTVAKIQLPRLFFLDGDEALKSFPPHLIEDLIIACHEAGSTFPACIPALGRERINKFRGREAHFESVNTHEKLLQARFRYGTLRQIVIVKDQGSRTVNNGLACIVVKSVGNVAKSRDRRLYTLKSAAYEIWTPSGNIKPPQSGVRKVFTDLLNADQSIEVSDRSAYEQSPYFLMSFPEMAPNSTKAPHSSTSVQEVKVTPGDE